MPAKRSAEQTAGCCWRGAPAALGSGEASAVSAAAAAEAPAPVAAPAPAATYFAVAARQACSPMLPHSAASATRRRTSETSSAGIQARLADAPDTRRLDIDALAGTWPLSEAAVADGSSTLSLASGARCLSKMACALTSRKAAEEVLRYVLHARQSENSRNASGCASRSHCANVPILRASVIALARVGCSSIRRCRARPWSMHRPPYVLGRKHPGVLHRLSEGKPARKLGCRKRYNSRAVASAIRARSSTKPSSFITGFKKDSFPMPMKVLVRLSASSGFITLSLTYLRSTSRSASCSVLISALSGPTLVEWHRDSAVAVLKRLSIVSMRGSLMLATSATLIVPRAYSSDAFQASRKIVLRTSRMRSSP
mmetsp:Transcript_23366/g.88689  ORF Transcript_23366/g.88689 Transcript_23366/m.88689 type:complete len:369 (-) Transcript_23366:216-1322(-)